MKKLLTITSIMCLGLWSCQSVKNFSDALGLSTFAAEDNTKRVIDSCKLTSAEIEKRYAREIALATLKLGIVRALDLEKSKLFEIRSNTDRQIIALEELQTKRGSLNVEEKKFLDDLKSKNLDIKNDLAINAIKQSEAVATFLKKIKDNTEFFEAAVERVRIEGLR